MSQEKQLRMALVLVLIMYVLTGEGLWLVEMLVVGNVAIIGFDIWHRFVSKPKEYIGRVIQRKIISHRRRPDVFYCIVQDEYGNNHSIICHRNDFCELERGVLYEFKVTCSPLVGEMFDSAKPK